MSHIQVRKANYSDIDTLYAIFSETDQMHQEAYPEIFRKIEDPIAAIEYYKDCIDESNALICIAEENDIVFGALICTLQHSPDIPVLMPRIYACIENITVQKTHRGQGIGSALIYFAQAWAMKKKAASMELTVWEFNNGAAEFYRHLGFSTYRCRMKKDLK